MNRPVYDSIASYVDAAESAVSIEELREIVAQLAHFARTVVEESENLYAKLMVDELTGIPSYDAYKAEIEPELNAFFESRERRAYPYDYLIVVADMDGLSTINNTLGHAAGDTALRNFAQILSSSTRAQDWVGRSGKKADEFLAVIRVASPESQAAIRASFIDRIQRGMHEVDPTISASIGVAIASEHSSLVACLEAADDLMYENKLANYENMGIVYKPNRK